MDWTENNNYLRGIINKLDNLWLPVRVASFDLDDTLIHRPNSRAKDKQWKLLDMSIVDKIADLVKNHFIIVIFTNQGGMSMNKNFDQPKWRQTMDDLVELLTSKIMNKKYYFATYVSKKHDIYRKPNIGMWNMMKDNLKEEFKIEIENNSISESDNSMSESDHSMSVEISKKSFFCGDAAGRITNSIYKKSIYPTSTKQGDHTDTDRKFAMNIGITFMTPEEFFLGKMPDPEFKLLGLNPSEYLKILKTKSSNSTKSSKSTKLTKSIKYNTDYKNSEVIKILDDNQNDFIPRKREMIIMVGPMGSGKSQYVQKYILPHKYVYVNQDTCKTKIKCDELTKSALKKGKSVVIDATNPDVLSRMHYTAMAREYDYKHIRAIIINTPPVIFSHLNNVRHLYSKGKIPKINNIAYASFKKRYVKPLKTEYFDKIDIIDFIFDMDQLTDPKWKEKFLLWSEF